MNKCGDCNSETDNTCKKCNSPFCKDCEEQFEICDDCDHELEEDGV